MNIKQYNVDEYMYTMLEESKSISGPCVRSQTAVLLGGSQATYMYFTLHIVLTGIEDCTMLVLLR